MDIQHNALIVVFIITILLGLFGTIFFSIVPMQVQPKDRRVLGYFVAFYACLVLGSIFYIVRAPLGSQVSAFINGTLFLTAAFSLRHGFLLRKHPQSKHLIFNKFYWLCVALMVVVNVFFLHQIYPSFWLRIAFMNWLSCCILLSFIPLINTNEQWTNGERAAKYAAMFFAALFFLIPAVYIITKNISLYVLSTMILEVLIINIWLSCLCALMMSDVIQMHYQNSINDALTGIYNRRFFIDYLRSCKCKKEDSNALVICDLDDFKSINDTYGHTNGDLVIVKFAQLLRDNVEKDDVVARIGGEEFALCLKDVTIEEAQNITERLKELTNNTALKTKEGKPIKLSASFGICACSQGVNIDDVLHRADNAMYKAKKNGKNQVCLFG